MKCVYLVYVLLLAGSMNTGPVMADTVQGNGPTGPGMDKQQDFATIQQRVEQRIRSRISQMQDRLTCVQNAQDRQSLRSCLPNRGRRRPGGGPGMGQGPAGGQ